MLSPEVMQEAAMSDEDDDGMLYHNLTFWNRVHSAFKLSVLLPTFSVSFEIRIQFSSIDSTTTISWH